MDDNQSLTNRKIAILGAGVSGLSLAAFARRMGADVFLSDAGMLAEATAKSLRESGIAFESGGHTDRIFDCDQVVVGSGFPPHAEIVGRIASRGIRLCGELDFIMPYLHGRFIGVTGSNGKTTTASLIGHLLSSLGLRVATVGNIGRPIAEIACREFDYIVAELSSFQLHWAGTLQLDAAVVTNLAPDHIDWHGSYDNYVSAKGKILTFVKESGFSILRAEDFSVLKPSRGKSFPMRWDTGSAADRITLDASEQRATLGETVLFHFCDTSLIGRHNMENVAMSMAALALFGEDLHAAVSALSTYVPPPHRCSLVLSEKGVRYIDDSKGTNIAATVTALQSIDGRKLIILGGKGKGENYENLLPALNQHAKWAFVMGEAADDICEALSGGAYSRFTRVADMEEAVRRAKEMAEPNDVVLLSPACTSWDMYNNYGERGEHFVWVVKKLAGIDNSETK